MVTVNKNILLIGRTGSGKSSLANVLSGTDEFVESANGTSETKSIKEKRFEIDGVKYCVIDTIGIGDTQLDDTKKVLFRLGEIARFIENEGLNQIFFVTGSRFTKEEIETYKLLSSIIFDQDVFNYTTIVRTNFPAFENETECEKDKAKLCNESKELNEIFNHAKVIYVDNPALLGRPAAIAINKETRELSRKRLITYLGAIIHKNYLPANLKEVNDRIRDYMTEKERLEKELKEKEEMIKKMLENHERKIKEIKEEIDKKMKDLEDKKDKETKDLKLKLDEGIENLKKEGKASKEKITSLKNQYEKEKKNSEEKWKKEINKINKEKEEADNKMKILLKKHEDEINKLKTKNKELVKKVADEIEKRINQKKDLGLAGSMFAGTVTGAAAGSIIPGAGTLAGGTAGLVAGAGVWIANKIK
ncbi:GTPase [endosymbiont GvMRE of Glomus versiforme]|uniref:GTPase n=1 Tax=endosymbiont GvMRE of Glomus versiforme TaxID=2039283 RepID=UPI000EBEE45F|nr:GTPase [endosymbiont GvMRE of Glomus versiforme]RHZ35518.1 GTPase IMAP family member 7 [endosymbiont GvMRE of Glomus versiforme]